MRTRVMARVLVGLVVAGSLAACGMPGGGGSPPGVLTINPNPGFFDLEPNSLSDDTVVFTVKNIGFAETSVSVEFTINDLEGLDRAVASGCFEADADLAPGESCTIVVTILGTSAPLGTYEAFLRVTGDNGGDATAPLILI